MKEWSSEWNSSTKPAKQRKYRRNAPLHVKDNLVSANVAPEIRDELDTRSISLRTGDRAKVMRGDDKGKSGIVNRIDREDEKVYLSGIDFEKPDGTTIPKALRPSNLQVQALNIEDERRLAKFDVKDVEDIAVEEEEMEEALEEEDEGEMMKQMQTGESSLESGENEEEAEPEEDEEETDEELPGDADYGDIVTENISDVKSRLEELEEPDFEAALEAEKANKNRKTLVEWLENRV